MEIRIENSYYKKTIFDRFELSTRAFFFNHRFSYLPSSCSTTDSSTIAFDQMSLLLRPSPLTHGTWRRVGSVNRLLSHLPALYHQSLPQRRIRIVTRQYELLRTSIGEKNNCKDRGKDHTSHTVPYRILQPPGVFFNISDRLDNVVRYHIYHSRYLRLL
jgi:hypothetical protein